MTNANRDLIDDIIDSVALAMTNSDILTDLELTAEDVEVIKTNIGLILDFISEQFDEIKDFNAANLSAADIAILENFETELSMKIIQIRVDQSATKS